MADDSTTREAKLTQYLVEALGKEKELEVALAAHIEMTTRKPYQKRLKDHLKETKNHSKQLERRIKKISSDGAATVAKGASQLNRALAAAKGPLHSIRGNSETEKMLKNAKTEYFNEHEEIATYTAIEVLADQVGDKETAKMARGIRREEERMASFLEKQIPVLTRQMVKEDLPAAARKPAKPATKTRSRSNGASPAKKTAKAASKAGSRTRSTAKKAAGKK
jgi:ferritin-like metal-binding protein YciE